MLARSGDLVVGTAHARNASDALPPEKHSLTLRLLMAEVEQPDRPALSGPVPGGDWVGLCGTWRGCRSECALPGFFRRTI
ncbi:hypothetical protein [Streptomyces sp. WM6368]|uniref:hypothetical protein n=1 Tax=Streptomyces sp. WM6368 TaxID=1415554 RepID=UPI002D21D9CB|nr:hypothetical protein [Streptomyces sp. WM6368]